MEKESNEKKEFSQRLVQALLKKGFKSKHASSGVAIRELSIATGISMEMARRYTLGLALPKPNVIKIIADWLNVSPLWLRDGITASDIKAIQLPLIPWEQINYWQPGNKTEHTHLLHVSIPISEQAYAVAMVNDLTPALPQGTILIIEPNKQANHKSLVLVTSDFNTPVELKQYWIDNNMTYLKALDSNDKNTFTPQMHIKGVFVAADFNPSL